MNKRIVHDALILTAFTLVLGFILALVQGITAEPIDKANKAAAQKAYQAVFSDAKSLRNMIMMLMKLISLYLMRGTRIQSMILRLPLIQTKRH